MTLPQFWKYGSTLAVQLLSKSELLSLLSLIAGSTKAAMRVIRISPIFFSAKEGGILADLKEKIFLGVRAARNWAKCCAFSL